jgi:hypothetical protein
MKITSENTILLSIPLYLLLLLLSDILTIWEMAFTPLVVGLAMIIITLNSTREEIKLWGCFRKK